MSVLDDFVLVLNKNWTPINTCSVRGAFCDLFSGSGRFIDTDDFSLHEVESWLDRPVRENDVAIRTARLSIRAPEIIVLRSGVVPVRHVMAFSRKNLIRRDRMSCQYCGVRPGAINLTVDHVMPKTRGGKSSWLNCVMSCKPCNTRKADRTLEQSGMRLRPRPEMQMLHPNEPEKWSLPYEPAWSPIFRVHSTGYKPSWEAFVNKLNEMAS